MFQKCKVWCVRFVPYMSVVHDVSYLCPIHIQNVIISHCNWSCTHFFAISLRHWSMLPQEFILASWLLLRWFTLFDTGGDTYWESALSSNSENPPEACPHCGKSPCYWATYQDELSSIGLHTIAMYEENKPGKRELLGCSVVMMFFL